MEKAWLNEAVEFAKELWRAHLINPTEESMQFVVSSLDPQGLSVIGTGLHEFFSTKEQLFEGLLSNQAQAQAVIFSVIDEYYEVRAIGVDACCVAGTLWVREQADKPKQLLIEMDTRFSLVFRRHEGRWVVSHLHHSVPSADQERGETYPGTAIEKANAALEYAKVLERRAELDPMTGLLNHVAFEKYVLASLSTKSVGGAFFMIDLDNLKIVNDTLGHPEGDKVIDEFANLLSNIFTTDAFIARMGGDEFAVYLTGPTEIEGIEAKAHELVESWHARSEAYKVDLGCSVGLVRAESEMTFSDLYSRADEALYRSKYAGKGDFCW